MSTMSDMDTSGAKRQHKRWPEALKREIVAATHNPLYLQLYASMTDVFASHMRHEESGDDARAHRHHHDLVEAIADGDASRATALVAAIFEPFMR